VQDRRGWGILRGAKRHSAYDKARERRAAKDATRERFTLYLLVRKKIFRVRVRVMRIYSQLTLRSHPTYPAMEFFFGGDLPQASWGSQRALAQPKPPNSKSHF
jgi:ribosomal protein S21